MHITDDGIVNKIEGDPTNPSNKGKLCPKGNAAIMRHYDPKRFKQPLKRTYPKKGPGEDPMWEPISWDEAFDLVATELKKTIDDGTGDGFSSHLHAAAQSHWVANARMDRGMRCVTIEPRLSISAAKSEKWIPNRPATDRHFALGLCHVMVNEELCDYRFLRKDTNAPSSGRRRWLLRAQCRRQDLHLGFRGQPRRNVG